MGTSRRSGSGVERADLETVAGEQPAGQGEGEKGRRCREWDWSSPARSTPRRPPRPRCARGSLPPRPRTACQEGDAGSGQQAGDVERGRRHAQFGCAAQDDVMDLDVDRGQRVGVDLAHPVGRARTLPSPRPDTGWSAIARSAAAMVLARSKRDRAVSPRSLSRREDVGQQSKSDGGNTAATAADDVGQPTPQPTLAARVTTAEQGRPMPPQATPTESPTEPRRPRRATPTTIPRCATTRGSTVASKERRAPTHRQGHSIRLAGEEGSVRPKDLRAGPGLGQACG